MSVSPVNVATEKSVRTPGYRALTVARWVQDRVGTGTVLLFGSRARGDWEDYSDIDVAVLAPERLPPDTTNDLTNALYPDIERLFGTRVPLQLFSFSEVEFEQGRTSPNHLLGGIQREGLDPQGHTMPWITQNNPWPDVQQCLRATRTSLHDALTNQGTDNHRLALYYAVHAMENGLKAYARACGVRYDKTHDLATLVTQVRTADPAVTLPPIPWREELTKFRVATPYDVNYPLPFPVLPTLTEAQSLRRQLATRALELCGKTPDAVGFGELAGIPLDISLPLGGVETANPGNFHVETNVQIAREEARVESLLAYAQERYGDAEAVALKKFLDSFAILPPLCVIGPWRACWRRISRAKQCRTGGKSTGSSRTMGIPLPGAISRPPVNCTLSRLAPVLVGVP